MNIRKMTLKDISEVAEIERLCFSHPWSEESIKDSFDNPCNHFYISEKENKITGYIGLSVIIDEGYILNVAVHPDYQGMGIGKELVKYVNDFAVENNLTFVTLEVRPSNEKAINLYTGFGFKKVGERKDYYSNPKENAFLLTKYYISKKE